MKKRRVGLVVVTVILVGVFLAVSLPFGVRVDTSGRLSFTSSTVLAAGTQIPSYKDTIASDTTINTAFEDIDGLSVSVTLDQTSDVLLFASVEVLSDTARADGGAWRLVFDGSSFQELQRALDTVEPGNLSLVDRVVAKASGAYTFKLQHKVLNSGDTLTTKNAIIVAIILHDGTGAVPNDSASLSTDTVGNAWEDIPFASNPSITLSKTSHIWAVLSWYGSHSGNDKGSDSLINLDGIDMENTHRHFSDGGELGAISLSTRTTTELSAGTYTVKARWKGAAGSTLTGNNFVLVTIAAEAQSGAAGIDIQKVVVASESTAATTIEDIIGSSVTAEVDTSAHIFGFLSFHSDVSTNAKSVYTTVSLDGADQQVMERGHAEKQVHGSVGQVVRTASALSSGSKTVKGRWYTDSGNTMLGEDIVLTTIVLETVDYVAGLPQNFTATYIDIGQVDLSWTKGDDAVNTLVRAAYNRLPSSITDGYQVYYGDGESYSDTAMDFDEYLGKIYYAAWSENATGLFTGDSVSDFVEGVPMLLFALVVIPLGLTIAMFHTRNMMLGFPCVIFWAVLGGYTYGESTIPWGDWQYFLFFASMGMVIFSSVAMYGLRERRDTIADAEMEEDGEKEGPFIDEETEPSKRTQELRNRAKQRKESRRGAGGL